MKLSTLALSLGLSVFSASFTAHAHTTWIAQVHGEQAVNYGHTGTDTDAYDPKKIVSAKGFKRDGTKFDLTIKKHENHVSLEGDDAAISTAVMDGGFWSQDKDGKWVNERGDKVDGAKSSALSLKYTVSYNNSRVKPIVTGHALEIVPAVNPATLKKGEDLKVQVLYEGKGVADLKVVGDYFSHEAEKYTTDKDGFVTVKVANDGFNIIEVGYQLSDPKDPFNGKNMSSTLTFMSKSDSHHH